MKHLTKISGLALSAGLVGVLIAGAATMKPQTPRPFMTPESLKWVKAPAALPSGAMLATLEGDPGQPGSYTMRAKIPAGYKIPPHMHDGDEHVTVIEGTFFIALGDKWDTAKGKELPAGSFALLPKGTKHFAWSADEAIIQLHGTGPWAIHYLNPADDPRNKPVKKPK